jgi:ABC-type antimicrobial peptide transport system permease subunit
VECNFPLINGGIKNVETLTYNSLGKVCLYKNEQITGGKSTEDFSMSIEYDGEGDKRKIVSKNPDNEICILYQYWNPAEEKCLDSVLQCEYPQKNKLSGKASVKRFSKLFEDEGWDNNSVGEYLNDGFQIKDGNGRIVKRKTEYGLENMVYNQEGNCAFYSHLFTSEIDGKKVVNTVTFVSKEEAMKSIKERLGDKQDVLEGLDEENFLPASYFVTLNDLSKNQQVQEEIMKFDGVEEISTDNDTIAKLNNIAKGIRMGTLIILVILVVISIAIIAYTVKITVYARRKEIEIMKYVGATNSFVRGPFIIEGLIIGIISAAIA